MDDGGSTHTGLGLVHLAVTVANESHRDPPLFDL